MECISDRHLIGERSEILRTNLGIRAIELAPGEHRIVMTFEPRSLRFGLVLTCLGIALTAVYWWGQVRKSGIGSGVAPYTDTLSS